MADYFPPSENLPIFDVSVFRSTNDNVITQDEADRLYLSRLGTASSLATSTSFAGTVSCGGNLTLTAPLASNRQIEGSFLKLVDNASISTNKPLIWYPDPSLQITTNDVVGAVKTIDLKSFNGAGTGVSTSLTCQYGQVQAQGTIKLTRNTDVTRFSNFTMGATELTISNEHTGASPHINLNTPTAGTGRVITNSPLQITNKADPTKASTITQGVANLLVSNDTATGNITLNTIGGSVTSNSAIVLNSATNFKRAITSSLHYWTDYAGVSANVPYTYYDTNALITSTNDVASVEYINFNSFDGTVTNNRTTFQCGYNEYVAQGALKITQTTNFNNRSTLVMGANDFTITNTNATGSILLNTTAGKIKYNSPIEPQVGSNPTSTLTLIGGTTSINTTNLGLGPSGSGIGGASVTLSAGTYMLVGSIHYSLSVAILTNMLDWGGGFNTTSGAFNNTIGTPYFASLNYIKSTANTNTFSFNALTSGPRMQTVMNINVTTSTTVFLNFVCNFNNIGGGGGTSAFDVYSTLMTTRLA